MLGYVAVGILTLLIFFYYVGKLSSGATKSKSIRINKNIRINDLAGSAVEEDYKVWVSIIKDRRPNLHEFELSVPKQPFCGILLRWYA